MTKLVVVFIAGMILGAPLASHAFFTMIGRVPIFFPNHATTPVITHQPMQPAGEVTVTETGNGGGNGGCCVNVVGSGGGAGGWGGQTIIVYQNHKPMNITESKLYTIVFNVGGREYKFTITSTSEDEAKATLLADLQNIVGQI